MLMSNLISININIMDIKRRHMLICLYLSMLKANEKGEIALRTKDNSQEKVESVKLELLLDSVSLSVCDGVLGGGGGRGR